MAEDYHVIWEIDIWADSPEEAARKAFEIQQDPDTHASVFDVFDNEGRNYHIDLLDDDE